MLEFFKILFFSKTVLLTPYPVDMSGSLEIIPEKPLGAITTGASIEIDVSSMFQSEEMDIFEAREAVKGKILPGSVRAEIFGEDTVHLHYKGGVSVGGDVIRIQLLPDNGFPTDKEFKKVVIYSDIDMKSISIYWKNYKH